MKGAAAVKSFCCSLFCVAQGATPFSVCELGSNRK